MYRRMGIFCSKELDEENGDIMLYPKIERGKTSYIKKDGKKVKLKKIETFLKKKKTQHLSKASNPSRKSLTQTMAILKKTSSRKLPEYQEEENESVSEEQDAENDSESSDNQEGTRSNTPPITKVEEHKREKLSDTKIAFGNTEVEYSGEVDPNTGKMDGIGEILFPTGALYKGKIVQDKCEGKGKLKLPGGGVYEGMFHQNKFHGKGRFTKKEGGFYFGDWVKSHKHGKGKEIAPDGSKYDGQFEHGKYNGKGELRFGNGIIYVGEFRDGKLHGHGTISQPDGTEVTAIFKNDEMVSQISLKKNTDVS
ncbi:unnamed protein product [Moneuplotes crassus]|uniref:MORN repeat protein n=1 Tax=Euplotes crassus TaxID=5936 RepID=A0AAD1UM51_EUPCR|nr:unnamed protein product [Moneuplotes crassus]